MSENIIIADLDEIVFEPRNKEYGAYQLRKSLKRSTVIGFIIGSAAIIMATAVPVLLSGIQDAKEEIVLSDTDVDLMDTKFIEEEEKPEEVKVEVPPPPPRDQVQFVPPPVVPDEEAPPTTTVVNQDSLQNMKEDVGATTQEGSGEEDNFEVAPTGLGEPQKVVVVEEKDPSPDDFVYVDEQPAPLNMSDIKKNIGYPSIMKDAGIQGKVVIKLLVDKTGTPKKHVVLKSPHDLLTEACVKEIYKLKFKPGIQSGNPIQVWVAIPFDFKLK